MKPRAARLAFAGILALFLLPLVFAWLMYSGIIDYEPSQTGNHGRLVEPPQPLSWRGARETVAHPEHPLDGAWVVLQPVALPCTAICEQKVTELRQVHRATGRHADRVRVALLLPVRAAHAQADALTAIYDEFHILQDPSETFREALERAGKGAVQPSVYLVDPVGNIMMTYETGDDMNGLRKDLKRLLTWSKMDEGP